LLVGKIRCSVTEEIDSGNGLTGGGRDVQGNEQKGEKRSQT